MDAMHLGKEQGILAKGMLADLAVLSQDLFTVPNEQLPATKSILTIVDGKVVYQSGDIEKQKFRLFVSLLN